MTHSLTEEDISDISDAIIDKFYAKSIFLYIGRCFLLEDGNILRKTTDFFTTTYYNPSTILYTYIHTLFPTRYNHGVFISCFSYM
jgi:hypothetical protein